MRRRSLVTGERLCTVCGPKYTRSSTTVRPNTAENSSMSAFVVDKSYMFFNASGAPYAISCAQTMRRRSLVTGERVGTVCALKYARSNTTVRPNTAENSSMSAFVVDKSSMFYNASGAPYAISCAQTMRRRSLVTGERVGTVCALKYARSNTTVRPNTAENSSKSAFVVDKSSMFYNASGAPYAISCAQTMLRHSLVTGERVGTVCALQAVHCNAAVGQNAPQP